MEEIDMFLTVEEENMLNVSLNKRVYRGKNNEFREISNIDKRERVY